MTVKTQMKVQYTFLDPAGVVIETKEVDYDTAVDDIRKFLQAQGTEGIVRLRRPLKKPKRQPSKRPIGPQDKPFEFTVKLPDGLDEVLEKINGVGLVTRFGSAGIVGRLYAPDEYELAGIVRDLEDDLNSTGHYNPPIKIGKPHRVKEE